MDLTDINPSNRTSTHGTMPLAFFLGFHGLIKSKQTRACSQWTN